MNHEESRHAIWNSGVRGLASAQLRLRGRGLTLMGFLELSLGFVWGEPIKVRQQKPVDGKYLDEAGPGPLQYQLECD